MKKSSLISLVAVVAVVIAVILVVLLVPGGTKKSTTSSSSSTANNKQLTQSQKTAAENQIKTNFATFFGTSASVNQRIALLQNGQQFAQVVQADFAQLASQKPSATVSAISFPTKTTAKVTYSVDLNGQPVLKNQTGESLLQNNKWLVSDSTLCQLLSLQGTPPSVCANVH